MEDKSRNTVNKSPQTVKNSPSEIHMGKIVRALVRQKNIGRNKFAALLGMNERSLSDLYRRKKLHTSLLEKISTALNHDMFQYVYTEGASPTEKKLQEKITQLEKEMEVLKTENNYLKEIVKLQKK